MKYFGGKARIGRKIANIVNEYSRGTSYWEPFCGACGVARHIDANSRVLSDVHPQLISMWNAVMRDWDPPKHVTVEDYEKAKQGQLSDPLTAFIGFGCSFGGKYFGGFARGQQNTDRKKTERNYASAARNSLLKAREIFIESGTSFLCCSFFDREPEEEVIYCDPPFDGTTPFSGVPEWNTLQFFARCEDLANRGHKVLVSEYKAPPHWTNLGTVRIKRGKKMGQGTNTGKSLLYDGDRVVREADQPIEDEEKVYLVTPHSKR